MKVILNFYTLSADVDYSPCHSSILAMQCNKAITCKSEVMDEWDILIQLIKNYYHINSEIVNFNALNPLFFSSF